MPREIGDISVILAVIVIVVGLFGGAMLISAIESQRAESVTIANITDSGTAAGDIVADSNGVKYYCRDICEFMDIGKTYDLVSYQMPFSPYRTLSTRSR